MSLDEYRRKRNPRKTPEPFGAGTADRDRLRFVIQRHAARRLHYDFRLERDGALASWAVPKGVPLRKGERHLAVHVEDHPLEYGDFEGDIPAGEYGAGTVEIWDRGTYDLLEEKRDGGLTVRLRGERLDGVWTLVPARLDGDPKNWLLLRKDAGDGSGGRYEPMKAVATDTLPVGEGWVFEPKWDGFRAIVTVSGGDVTLTSRNGNDLTERFRDVARAATLAITT
ncbi:MAG TPA: DNA polymerase ligase N-terminal domain-containing protein, partial [Gaiellaceae bacterium]|nr:DNA polymerase ligase N-terminal domain-containing protein [Gaiellaceae bacterium]